MPPQPKQQELIDKAKGSAEYRDHAEFRETVEAAEAVFLDEESKHQEIMAAIKSIMEGVKRIRGIIDTPDQPEPQAELPPELKESLERAHAEELEKWHWYGVLETNENGQLTYKADYDGSHEEGNTGENFTGQSFEAPTIQEVLTQLTTLQIELIKEMEAAGEEPRLQLTPLALNIRTLTGKLDAKKSEIGEPLADDTFVWDEIKDEELLYEASSFKASQDGKELHITNGLTKSQYIKKYKGWAIEIVATKQNLEDTKEGTNARKTEKYMQEFIPKGYRGLTYESYLSAQMQRLKTDPAKPLDKNTFTILPDSGLTEQQNIVGACWCADQVVLCGHIADLLLRCRRSVRVGRSASAGQTP